MPEPQKQKTSASAVEAVPPSWTGARTQLNRQRRKKKGENVAKRVNKANMVLPQSETAPACFSSRTEFASYHAAPVSLLERAASRLG